MRMCYLTDSFSSQTVLHDVEFTEFPLSWRTGDGQTAKNTIII